MRLINIILVLLLLEILTGTASAEIYYDAGTSQMRISDMPSVTLSDILSSQPTYITNEGNGVWLLNSSVVLTNSTLKLTSSEVTKLKWQNRGNAFLYRGDSGSLIIDGVNIIGWNSATNSPSTTAGYIIGNNIKFSNTTFENISYVRSSGVYNYRFNNVEMTKCLSNVYGIYISSSNNITMSNINIHHNSGGLQTYNVSNSIFRDLSLNNLSSPSIILFEQTNNSVFRNFKVENIGQGVWWQHSNNNTGGDFYINRTTWSSFGPQKSDNFTFDNVTVYYSGHSSLDCHNTVNCVFTNFSLHNAAMLSNGTNHRDGQNIMITGGYWNSRPASNITLKNFITDNGPIAISSGAHDIWIENLTQTNSDPTMPNGIDICAANVTIINVTQSRNIKSVYKTHSELSDSGEYWRPENIRLIDFWTNYADFDNSKGVVKLLNWHSFTDGAYHYNVDGYYYIEVRAEDQNGYPINNATVTNTANNNPGLENSTDGYLNPKSKFITSVRGRTALPSENRTNCMALPLGRRTSSWAFVSNDLNITNSGRSIILRGVGTSYYTSDPSISKYSVAAVFNNSKAPRIIGYAPDLKTSMYIKGESIPFRVWTSEPVVSRSWKVNGVEVSTSSDSYIYTATSSRATVSYTGITAKGKITKTWNVTPGSLEPCVNDYPSKVSQQILCST